MPTPEPSKSEKPSRGRWRFGLRYSLRTLLIVMTIACVVSGFWLNRAIRQRTAVRRFYQLTTQRSFSGSDQPVTMLYQYKGNTHSKPILPDWLHPLRDLVGEEAFGEVIGVQLVDTPTTDGDLSYVGYVPTMTIVSLSRTNVTDDGLAYLQACPKLHMLQLDGTAVTDEGVASLTVFTELNSLSLSGTKVTDAGLAHLAKLTKLKELWLRDTAITDAGYRKLQAALPGCEIQADVPAYTEKHLYLPW